VVSDDTEAGRPPRHDRPAKHGTGDWLDSVLTRGDGEVVTLEGVRACACGHETTIEFTGPSDSMGARAARAALAGKTWTCEECLDRADVERERAEGLHERAEQVRSRVAKAGLPGAWSTLTFDQLRELPGQGPAITAAQRWARGELPGVLLHGDTGRGKTVIAAASAAARCVLGAARWLSVAELLTDLRMPFDAPEYVRAIRKLEPGARGVALVLDDLDKMRPSEHQLQPLYVAVNAWLEARAPLFVTMNRDLEALASWGGETFGPPLASRLAGYCEVVEVVGEDWRLT
jgi:DNA replication protein DnaC